MSSSPPTMPPSSLVVLLLMGLLAPSLARPLPPLLARPLAPAFAQGLIAALTLAHTGIIAYAIHNQKTEPLAFIGRLTFHIGFQTV